MESGQAASPAAAGPDSTRVQLTATDWKTLNHPYATDSSGETSVIRTIIDQSARVLAAYRIDPGLILEHANGERRITQGGYGDRQLFELVQNAADEIAHSPGGKVHVVLTDAHLYCANEGKEVTAEGAETILRMSVSKKRGGQIGRFGVGVKSVLAVTDTPQFFSTSGAFGFDRAWSREEIRKAGGEAVDADFESPVLRMARPMEAAKERSADPVLDELLGWATTVVRLPLLPGKAERLGQDIHAVAGSHEAQREFPARFQLFSHHVGTVVLEDRRAMPQIRREITVEHEGVVHTVHEARTGKPEAHATWKVFTHAHRPTERARAGAGEMHDRVTIDISWAVPEYTGDTVLTVPRGRGSSGRSSRPSTR